MKEKLMNKNILSVAAVALALSASTALAAGFSAVVAEPVVIAAAPAAHDWSGAYVGLKFGRGSGDWTDSNDDVGTLDSGTARGLFGGYNLQNGNLVYGVEAGITDLGVSITEVPTAEISNFYEIKGRLGFAMDRVMAYGTVGYATGDVTVGMTSYDASGMTYGVGVDFMLTKSLFAGLELQRAALKGTYGMTDVNTDVDTVALRVGLQF